MCVLADARGHDGACCGADHFRILLASMIQKTPILVDGYASI